MGDLRASTAEEEVDDLPPPPPGGLFQVATAGTVVVVLGLIGWTVFTSWKGADLWDSAQASARAMEWDDAERALAEYARYQAPDPEVLRLRSFVAIQRGDESSAQGYLERVPDHSAHLAAAYLLRGRVLMRQRRLGEAERAFRVCVAHDPVAVGALRELLAICALERRAEEYEAFAWKFHEVGQMGESIEALRLLASGAAVVPPGQFGSQSDEVELLRRAITAEPEAPHLAAALGHVLIERGEFAAALDVLDERLATVPDDRHARIARAAARLGRDGPSGLDAEIVSLGLATEETTAEEWLLRGDWALARDRAAEADCAYRRAHELSPRSAVPIERRAVALRRLGLEDEALAVDTLIAHAHSLLALIPPPRGRRDDLTSERVRDTIVHVAALGRDREARAWAELLTLDDDQMMYAQTFEFVYPHRPAGHALIGTSVDLARQSESPPPNVSHTPPGDFDVGGRSARGWGDRTRSPGGLLAPLAARRGGGLGLPRDRDPARDQI